MPGPADYQDNKVECPRYKDRLSHTFASTSKRLYSPVTVRYYNVIIMLDVSMLLKILLSKQPKWNVMFRMQRFGVVFFSSTKFKEL